MSRDVFILGGARTPMTQHVGALKDFSAIDLGAIASKAALERTGTRPEWIDHVVFGNVQQSSVDAHYGARHVGLKAGLPQEVPALTVNRLCGSGIQAVLSGAQHIQLGEAGVVLAGGMENMSQVPHIIRGLRGGLKLGQGKLEDWLWEGLNDPYAGCSMAITAENCAVKYGITREDSDAYALRSQQLANKAWTSGIMKDEVTPVEIKSRKGVTLVEQDDHMRPETTMEVLAKLPTVFKKDGVVTAGNASGIVDGAAALVIAGDTAVKDKGLKPLGRIVSWATVGVDPTLMGMGPAPAIRKALERAGLKLADLDLIEINEAFAPQYLACEKELGLDREKVNVNGGAIALGHPLGASGARLLLTLLLELRRRGKKYGVASACIGGGQGIAMIVEAGV
ncbi:MAG TPA: acetyl-CoA C-acetyltransferase [Vicinamibacterales bacterium]|nr:acetyl-CoA C-acetyltransferase [Vicinamibacterales bacterium]